MTRIDADWIGSPEVQRVFAALAGHRVLFVGGCVRNALLGHPVRDVDLATDALPDVVCAAVKAAGLKAVPTGIDHGTVTVVSGAVGFELTTFRKDVETDGRRAVVVFSTRIEDDAARRDFTMNALYATAAGALLDPIGGLADLHAGRVRFIGDAAARIAEDYLRILRFFRFFAWYADPAGGIDAEGLAACAAGADGLERLPPERIGHEMRRLLEAPDPAPAVAAMEQSGILARVLPGASSTALPILVALEAQVGAGAHALRRLLCLGGDRPDTRFRLSRSEARLLVTLRDGVSGAENPAVLAYRHGAETALSILMLRSAMIGGVVPLGFEDEIARGAKARFPVRAADLMPGLSGPALGARLALLEQSWLDSGLALDRETLLRLK